MKLIHNILETAKTIVFEKGRMIYYLNMRSFRKSRRQIESKPRKQKIRVGFMVQVPNNWAVLEPVYLAAQRDASIEPVILLMPEVEFSYYIKIRKVDWESTYAFGQEKFQGDAVRLYEPETDTWKDPEELGLDYVFIPRPYETYLPKMYKASHLRRLCKVCYVPYSSPLLDDYRLLYNTHFIRNLSLIFCEKQYSYDYVTNLLGPTIASKDQKVFCTGFPKFDLNQNGEGLESPLWPRERSKDVQRVIWTPRWSMDPLLGVSSFMKYKDQMVTMAGAQPQMDLIFRPHPMAKMAMIRDGWMSEETWESYLDAYRKADNMAVDQSRAYYDLMWSSDVLVTDVSSMILDYLMTGHPLIYCVTPAMNTTSDDPKMAISELLPGLYVAREFADIEKYLKQLREGYDPKKEIRRQLADEMRRDGKIGEHIVGLIREDYWQKDAT
ncbi:MAG: CDP-glycerol glycerophosphotransferase family protein [Clostridia bacterium]|nr:CDP-glycerol glycerophosphotransferase family protein [Clostridia bacterium]